jgi:uncharacterized membrane protein YgaE (UPF0421/DUF939 family)
MAHVGQNVRGEQPPPNSDVDVVRAARAKTVIYQTSAVVLAAVIAAYFQLISNQFAMIIIVMMYLTIRLLT